MRARLFATVLALTVCASACGHVGNGKDAKPDYVRPWRMERCACKAGMTCNAGYPMSPCMPAARLGERCGTDDNCASGLGCDRRTIPGHCVSTEALAERKAREAALEAEESERESCEGPAPKLWDFQSPTTCKIERDYPAVAIDRLAAVVGANIRRIRYEPGIGVAALRAIARGVLFVMSGGGEAEKMLREVVRLVPPPLEIVVTDKGCMEKELVLLLGLRCDWKGDGEMVWLRGGVIVATTGNGFHPEKIEPNTRALLALP